MTTPSTGPRRLDFEITFRGPFHVARGQAADGTDRTIDRANPLAASSLKGLLRAEARETLGLAPRHIEAVFGAPRTPSPWAWSDARSSAWPDEQGITAAIRRTARIRMNNALAGQVEDEFLMIGEHVWAERAEFSVEQIGPVADRPTHELVLTAAALSVSALGGGRRRGEGWVSIRRTEFRWTEACTTALRALGEDS